MGWPAIVTRAQRTGQGLPPFAATPVLALAAGAAALLLVFSWRNGYHRDELYFLEASRHMAWGLVD